MSIVIIENTPVKYTRPKTTDSILFVGVDGLLYSGYYLKYHQRTALEYLQYFKQINNNQI